MFLIAVLLATTAPETFAQQPGMEALAERAVTSDDQHASAA